MSRFLMQVVDTETGEVVRYGPGSVVETDFVADVVQRVLAKGVGFGRTEAHVRGDVEAGTCEAIYALKARVAPGGR